MSVATIISHTPVWVWVLFAFLVKRGIDALSDREMTVRRLFILPLIFLAWGIWGLNQEFNLSPASLAGMATGLLAGTLAGWMLWKNQPRLRNKPGSELIIRAGTPLTLTLIIIAFVVKYCMTAWLALHPEIHHSSGYGLLFGLATGIVDGLFWGGTLNLFLSWRRVRSE